jgi:aryl sulfotransferase
MVTGTIATPDITTGHLLAAQLWAEVSHSLKPCSRAVTPGSSIRPDDLDAPWLFRPAPLIAKERDDGEHEDKVCDSRLEGGRISEAPVRYVSADEDSGRWRRFRFRQGDIVISARSKSGTTWLQTISALLIFQNPDLPAPLAELSPWLDWLVTPTAEVYARLDAQQHRRFIKTHTPLDGIPIDRRATYIVVARDPLDMAVSLYCQGDNLDRARIRQLTGQPEPVGSPKARSPLHEWLLEWLDSEASPRDEMDSLPGVMWHLSDAWRRRHEPNIILMHYDDLLLDLPGEMQALARRLGIEVPEQLWPRLVQAATFKSMSSRAEKLAPDPAGILKSRTAFFRRGVSGSGRELVTESEFARYRDRVGRMAPRDLVSWLLR